MDAMANLNLQLLETHAAEGTLWKLKESVQARIAQQDYTPEMYLYYGMVLLRMQDTMEAGRYLFWAGSLDPSHSEATNLFKRRFGRRWEILVSTAPRRLRYLKMEALPEVVQQQLRELKADPSSFGCKEPYTRKPETWRDKLQGMLFTCGCAWLAMFLVLSLAVGVFTVLAEWFKALH